MSALVNRYEVDIEFGDCDPAGIVYYPNYFRFFDNATVRLFLAATGLRKPALLERYGIVGIPMVDTGAQFARPSRFGDTVLIESQIASFGRSSFKVTHRLINGGEIAVEANEVRVWAGFDPAEPGKLQAIPIPDDLKALFEVSP